MEIARGCVGTTAAQSSAWVTSETEMQNATEWRVNLPLSNCDVILGCTLVETWRTGRSSWRKLCYSKVKKEKHAAESLKKDILDWWVTANETTLVLKVIANKRDLHTFPLSISVKTWRGVRQQATVHVNTGLFSPGIHIVTFRIWSELLKNTCISFENAVTC